MLQHSCHGDRDAGTAAIPSDVNTGQQYSGPLGKTAANTRVCGMGYVVCVYEIWLSVLDFSFVTQLENSWSMGYGLYFIIIQF